jgi:hypothetical protein
MLKNKILSIVFILIFIFSNISVLASDSLYVWSSTIESSTGLENQDSRSIWR